jgi:hypothetical protein
MPKKLISLKRPTVKRIAWGKPASRKKTPTALTAYKKATVKPSIKPTSKLLHLEHAEDHMIASGMVGYKHACETLFAVHDALLGKDSAATITEKYDGSPSLVFGHHPVLKKFFVSTKAFFNKEPKINYDEADIDRNYGYAPSLALKMKAALQCLPSIVPNAGIFQGDLMHVQGINAGEDEDTFFFTSNTITYSAMLSSELGKSLRAARISVALHTTYTGEDIALLNAIHSIDLSKFRKHPDVCVIDAAVNMAKVYYPHEAQLAFMGHMEKARNDYMEYTGNNVYDGIAPYISKLKKYINHTVRQGTSPDFSGFFEYTGEPRSVTCPPFLHLFDAHRSMQQAKDILGNALSFSRVLSTSINGKVTKGEGFVAVLNNQPTKLVDRAEFSRQNFLRQPARDTKLRTMVVTFARMNPPTIGHEKLIEKINELSSAHSAKHIVFLSSSHDGKNNPLTPPVKLSHLEKLFPDTCFHIESTRPSWLQQLFNVRREGTEHLIVVAGSDRAAQYEELLEKYNGRDEYFHFKKITVISAGDRKIATAGASATKMREWALQGDCNSFCNNLPSTASDEHAEEIYRDVRKGLD